MASNSPLAIISAANQAAFELGIFNWQMQDASYTNPNGTKVSFHVIADYGIPAAQYIEGEINAFNLIASTAGGIPGIDPNKLLFNTTLSATSLREGIRRKYVLNRVPFANYDQPVDLGIGSQSMNFHVVFSGTMYQSAMHNLVQCLFNNQKSGLGTLTHPFYGTVNNVLPISFEINYENSRLNCIVCDIEFLTSDISHLSPSNVNNTLLTEISTWAIAIENTILSLGGTISAVNALSGTAGVLV